MKRRKLQHICLLLLIILSYTGFSCVTEDQFSNTPSGNFEALWKIIDQKYCFLDYKHINWDSIHTVYAAQITPSMTNENLFEVLGNMLANLKDGHVDLISANDVARYWKWFEDYPENFDDSIQRKYLGNDYKTAGGVEYCILDDNIGYMYYSSFDSAIGEGNLNQILSDLAVCNGLIIDVRDNGGGTMTNATKLASRFTNKKIMTGYIEYKTGPGHEAFSDPYPIYLDPSSNIRWQKKVCVLTNRRSYSATNDFVNSMSLLDSVKIVGDKTGGGSGLPFNSELPNGWTVRFSACPILNVNKENIEWGINPDVKVDISSYDYQRGVDTIIETARKLLKK